MSHKEQEGELDAEDCASKQCSECTLHFQASDQLGNKVFGWGLQAGLNIGLEVDQRRVGVQKTSTGDEHGCREVERDIVDLETMEGGDSGISGTTGYKKATRSRAPIAPSKAACKIFGGLLGVCMCSGGDGILIDDESASPESEKNLGNAVSHSSVKGSLDHAVAL